MKDVFEKLPLYERVRTSFKDVLEGDRHSFRKIEPNLVEHEEVFAKTLGVSSDIVLKEMYSISGKGDDDKSGRLVLRPEGTAGVLRSLLTNPSLNLQRQQVKVWYYGPMYRHERPQAGRLRQFYQLGVESVGGAPHDRGLAIQSDLEAITTAWNCLKSTLDGAQTLLDSLVVEINNLGGRETLKDYNSIVLEAIRAESAKLSPLSLRRFESGHALRILDSKSPADQELLESLDLPSIDSCMPDSERLQFEELCEHLKLSGIRIKRNEKLVRGLDYYNGTCFEIKCPLGNSALGKSQNTLVAGGRYDYLAEVLTGKCGKIPAVGWAAGVDRLVLLLEEHKLNPHESNKP